MRSYVVGLPLVDEAGSLRLLLQRKARPDWQRGRLNGPGGKIEGNETPREAMSREFAEETSVEVKAGRWTHCVELHGDGWLVHFFTVSLSIEEARRAIAWAGQCTDEPLSVEFARGEYPSEILPNLRWIIPLALDSDVLHPVAVRDLTAPGQGATSAAQRGDA